MERNPVSDRLASRFSMLCPATGFSLIRIIGWITGITWETFPTSEDPSGNTRFSNVSPRETRFFRYTSSKDGVGTTLSIRFRCAGSSSPSQPVCSAAPFTISSSRRYTFIMRFTVAART